MNVLNLENKRHKELLMWVKLCKIMKDNGKDTTEIKNQIDDEIKMMGLNEKMVYCLGESYPIT